MIDDRYELRSPIGNGGMGTVWRATDTLLRREVAVKEVILPPTMPRSEQDALCERTMREARAAAALSHPSVVQVYDVVTDAGRPWIVMELLEARSLADMVIDDGPLAPRAVAKIGIAMLGALEVAHAAGVLHRDVKPANVLICADGRCVLTDFGVARLPTESNLTTPGMVLGSPHFISPERAVGGAFGPPSDLFSLGVTLYTAVEGGPPFDRGDPFETMRAVVEEAPRPTRLAGPLKPVLVGLLDKEPTRRWSVDQARAVLREMLSGALSRTGQAREDTDTQAVVRPPAGPPPAVRDPANQVGGRAMLDPNKSLSGQLAHLSPGRTVAPEAEEPARPRPIPAQTGPTHSPDGRSASSRAEGAFAVRAPRRSAGARRPGWAPGQPPAGPRGDRRRDGLRRAGPGPPPRAGRPPARSVHRRPAGRPDPGRQPGREHPGQPDPRDRGDGARRHRRGRRRRAAPGRPRRLRPHRGPARPVHADGHRGHAADSGPGVRATRASRSTCPRTGRSRRHRPMWTLSRPAGRARSASTSRPAPATAQKFLTTAETGLKKPSICPSPYARVALIDSELGKQPAAQLEYTCGSGDAKRHGIWQAVVVDGKAYHFYLTVPDSRFDESKVIFEEMLRSFHFTG